MRLPPRTASLNHQVASQHGRNDASTIHHSPALSGGLKVMPVARSSLLGPGLEMGSKLLTFYSSDDSTIAPQWPPGDKEERLRDSQTGGRTRSQLEAMHGYEHFRPGDRNQAVWYDCNDSAINIPSQQIRWQKDRSIRSLSLMVLLYWRRALSRTSPPDQVSNRSQPRGSGWDFKV